MAGRRQTVLCPTIDNQPYRDYVSGQDINAVTVQKATMAVTPFEIKGYLRSRLDHALGVRRKPTEELIMYTSLLRVCAIVLAVLMCGSWDARGHISANSAAVQGIPPVGPVFLKQHEAGAGTVAPSAPIRNVR